MGLSVLDGVNDALVVLIASGLGFGVGGGGSGCGDRHSGDKDGSNCERTPLRRGSDAVVDGGHGAVLC
jgi:hypothetical protein